MQPWREASSLIIVTRASLRASIASNSNIIRSSIVESLSAHQSAQGVSTTDETRDHATINEPAEQLSEPSHSSNKQSQYDYRLMMVKRSGLSSFLASAYVFPGGRVEIADFSPRWWELFEKFNLTRQDLALFSQSITGPRPPIILESKIAQEAAQSNSQQDVLPADIGLRISALRETFEETGVLLLTRPGDDADSYQPLSDHDNVNVDLSAWRDRVRKDAAAFLDLCFETNLCPNLWSLYEWWNWLTPTSVGHKRCDTMFYVSFLEVEPKVVLDNEEVTTLKVSNLR
jgi:nucleoside diphosphate-linked moiety X motif protein 19